MTHQPGAHMPVECLERHEAAACCSSLRLEQETAPVDGQVIRLGDVGSNLSLLLVHGADAGSLVFGVLEDDCRVGASLLQHDLRALLCQLQVTVCLQSSRVGGI